MIEFNLENLLKSLDIQNPIQQMQTSHNPLSMEQLAISQLREFEREIKYLEQLAAEISFKHSFFTYWRDVMTGVVQGYRNQDKSAPKPTPKNAPKKPEAEAEANTSPATSVEPRLKILEEGIKKALNTYKKAPMSKCFKGPKLMNRMLSLAVKPGLELTEFERIARMEAAIGEALNFLQTSKMAARSNVLKEMKKILEETIDKSSQA
jgi:hypothetical protein